MNETESENGEGVDNNAKMRLCMQEAELWVEDAMAKSLNVGWLRTLGCRMINWRAVVQQYMSLWYEELMRESKPY